MHRAVAVGHIHSMINIPFYPVRTLSFNRYSESATLCPVLCKVLKIQWEETNVSLHGADDLSVCVCVWWGGGVEDSKQLSK